MRQKNYPKWIEAGRMSEEQAKRQIAALEAVIRTLEIRPWPQVLELTKQWRDKAEGLSVLGVLAPKLHRDELLAVLAFAVDALRKAGIIGGKKP